MALELFTCPRHAGGLTLTATGCASMWRRARASNAEQGDYLHACRGCEIGARHAGEKVEVARAEAQRLEWGKRCARCGRLASRIIHGRNCVSCFNRGAEVIKGRNAKGKPPVHLPRLFTFVLSTIDFDDPHEVVVRVGAAHLMEAVFAAATCFPSGRWGLIPARSFIDNSPPNSQAVTQIRLGRVVTVK